MVSSRPRPALDGTVAQVRPQDRLAGLPDHPVQECQVVHRGEDRPEHLPGQEEVAEVGAAELSAGRAVAPLLDRPGVDVVAAADDEILGPPGDPQIAIRVQPAQVAGAQIDVVGEQVVVLVGFGIGRSGEDAGIGDADFPHHVGRAFMDPAPVVVIEDADLSIG